MSKSKCSNAETKAFTKHINNVLAGDKDLPFLPMNPDNGDLYKHIASGLLMAKMINKTKDRFIDERALNKPKKSRELNPYQLRENQQLVIGSAKAIGCVVVNVHPSDLVEGKPKQTLALVWQIVRMQLMASINLREHPELYRLLEEGEDLEMLLALPPEDILIRWVNYHMKEAGSARRVTRMTFGRDMKDSECYTTLLNQIAPKNCDKKAMECTKLKVRATHVLRNAANLPAKNGSAKLVPMIGPATIASGNKRLNYAFLAQIFNHNPGLLPDDDFDPASMLEDGEGTREERVFRMWMNSLLGPEGFYINSLYQDLRDGLHLLRVEDRVQPGCVPWRKVDKKSKSRFTATLNCDIAVQVAQDPLLLKVVGIGGADIFNRIRTLVLGIVWQLLRQYTMNMLTRLGTGGKKIKDRDIIKWANDMAAKGGAKGKIKSFRTKSLSSGVFLLNLMRGMEPRAINEDLITEGSTEEEQEQNARYALSVARKIGAIVFITYEDIVEVKPKMIMMLLAACMAHASGHQEKQHAAVLAEVGGGTKKKRTKKKKRGGKKKVKSNDALSMAKLNMSISKGSKLKKSKKKKAKANDSLSMAKLNISLNKGKKLKKGKAAPKSDSALSHAKVSMEISKGAKLKKVKAAPESDSALSHAKVNMELAKERQLNKVDVPEKDGVPEWAVNELKKE